MHRSVAFVLWSAGCLAFSAEAEAQGRMEAAWRNEQTELLPMTHAALRIDTDRQRARITLDQAFHNRSGERLEGRYAVRTGQDTTVHGFSYWNGEQRIVGEVFEKEEARQIYEEVTGQGRDPGLFEQLGEGHFSFRVFPIEPDERKRVQVVYDQWLKQHGTRVELVTPWEGSGTEASGDDVRIDLHDERGIGDVRSRSHHLTFTRIGPTHVEVNLSGRRKLGDDLQLSYGVGQPPMTLTAALHQDAGHDGYLLLHLASPTQLKQPGAMAKDVTLVIDRSGSMQGAPMQQARLAAENLLARLSPEDRINVVSFESQAESLFAKPRQATADTIEEARRYVRQLDAGGGTDIAAALATALSGQNRDALPDVVLFLTDGASDPQAALQTARENHGDVRLFTVGIGNGVNKPLLSRLASDKRGRFTFIASESAIADAVDRLYTQIARPVLVDVSIELKGARLSRVYPRSMPDLFLDDELRITARLAKRSSDEGPVVATLKGKLGGKPVQYTTKVDAEEVAPRPWVGSLWAQARVDDLLQQIALEGATQELTDEVIELALAYDFVTPYTSFLAIPESEVSDAVADRLQSARVRKAQIKRAHQDALSLSRSQMPPGDPVLSVRAPQDAREVVARFPFGLTLHLRWDDFLEQWTTRFLVPNDVPDGDYEVQVWIVHGDGEIKYATIPYTIDSQAPEVDVQARPASGGFWVRALVNEEPQEVLAMIEGQPDSRTFLTPGRQVGCAYAWFDAPPGHHTVRLVVVDDARNEVLVEHEVVLGDDTADAVEGDEAWCR